MCSPIEAENGGLYTRAQAIRDGFLREVGNVIDADPFLVQHLCAFDSVCLPVSLYELKISQRGGNAELVDLLYRFVEALVQSPTRWEDVSEVSFKFRDWLVKVRAHVEDGLQCLTITEQQKPQEVTHG